MKTSRSSFVLCLLTAVVAGSLMTACGGGSVDDDPDFDGPEWEGGCPEPREMRGYINASIEHGSPPPPYEIYCPSEYAAMKNLK